MVSGDTMASCTSSWRNDVLAATLLLLHCAGVDSEPTSLAAFGRRLSQSQRDDRLGSLVGGVSQLLDAAGDSSTFAAQIVGGQDAEDGRYPFMCSLRSADGKHFCGCSLIGWDAVLTAAHCVDKKKEEFKRPIVHLGRFYRNHGGGFEERKAQKVVFHPNWDPASNTDDAAIILLDRKSGLRFVRLIEEYEGLDVGEDLTVLGWGLTSEGGKPSETLQEAIVQYIAPDECRMLYGGRKITKSMLCAGQPGGGYDACQGDSGGPIIRKKKSGTDVQVGLVSWGHGCARPGLPGIYTRISELRPWIDETLKDLSHAVTKLPSVEQSHKPSKKYTSTKPRNKKKQDNCDCSGDGKSGDVMTNRKGCDQHLKEWGDNEYFCMVVGGLKCESAKKSRAYPGTGWRLCEPLSTAPGRTQPSDLFQALQAQVPRIYRPRLTGSISFGGLDLTVNIGSQNASPGKEAIQTELCVCSQDGMSGNRQTDYKGCGQHSWITGRYDYWCMVTGGTKCSSATPSTAFEGAAWKPCSV